MIRWFYLLLFVLIVAVPHFIVRDLPLISEEYLESSVILSIGIVAGTVFAWREKQFRRHMAEKRRYQQAANNASKDLAHSYSYIGEINRQLEILKNIALGLPEGDVFTDERRRETFEFILEAIMVFAHTENFSIRFVNMRTGKTAEEMSMGGGVFSENVEQLIKHRKHLFRVGEHSVVRTAHPVRGHLAFLLLDRQQVADDDADFLRAILSQALFLFVWGREVSDDETEVKKPG